LPTSFITPRATNISNKRILESRSNFTQTYDARLFEKINSKVRFKLQVTDVNKTYVRYDSLQTNSIPNLTQICPVARVLINTKTRYPLRYNILFTLHKACIKRQLHWHSEQKVCNEGVWRASC
jgi:hypothetical protein